ncbi:TPA: SPASM domain-containing protein [Citrobacter gillenii]
MEHCHMIAKHSTELCNLHCTCCLSLNKTQLYPECQTYCTDDTTLQLFIRQEIDARETKDILFSWKDDELTSDRLNFFKRVIELQQQFAQGKNIINTLLTSGMLLDDDWCIFFKTNNFLISISVDSDIPLRDNNPKSISSKATTPMVEKSINLLQKHDIEFTTLTVINALNCQQPLRVYHYLKSLGSRHMLFIPLFEPLAQGGVDAKSLAPAALGTFLKTIFYTWVRLDIGTIKIPFFERAFVAWCGVPAPACAFTPFNNNYSVFASKISDDLCQCDRFINSKFLLSTPHQYSTTTMRESTINKIVEQRKPPLVKECASCKVKLVCNDGCPKDRIAFSQRGAPELNYFCESYQAFFTYVNPYMLMMRALWEQNYTPSDIRQYLV